MKVVINKQFGGFGLSAKGVRKYSELKGFSVFAYGDNRMLTKVWNSNDKKIIKLTPEQENSELCVYWIKKDLGQETTSELLNEAEWFHERDIKRDDEDLVKVVKLLKKEVNGRCADLKIITIPDGVEYIIEEYDGLEHIAEKHRTWG